jgi:hypothetical protein
LQDVAERSRQKSDMLQGYGDTVLQAEALEEQLEKACKHAAGMQSKLDTAFAHYHNEIQDMQARAMSWCGRTSLSATRIKVRDCLVGYLLIVA